MAKAEIDEILNVDFNSLWSVVTAYENYPQFVTGCTGVEVERKAPGRARAKYSVSMMKDITYTLDHVEDPANKAVSWSLVESDFLKKNDGRWEFEDLGGGKTNVHYEVEVEFKFPVPSLILNRVVKGTLPAMIKSFETQAKKKK